MFKTFFAASVLTLTCLTLPSTLRAETTRSALLDLQFGKLRPNIDGEKGLGGDPFNYTFGDSNPLWFQTQVSWEFFKAFGTASIGGGPGMYKFKGAARFESGTKSKDSTTMLVIPWLLSLTYRYDAPAQASNFPLVPYGRVGLDYHMWWIKDARGNVAKVGKERAEGARFGYHYALGLQFLLDALDRHSAGSMDFNYGINSTYFFIEYIHLKVDDFGGGFSFLGKKWGDKGFDLGDDTLMFGLTFEM